MSEFDWIQWYAFVVLVLGVIINIAAHGKPCANHDFRVYFIAVLLASPTYGRVFGVW